MLRTKALAAKLLEWADRRLPSGQFLDSGPTVQYTVYKWCLRHQEGG